MHGTTPSTPLKSGADYQWQVTAARNGEEVKLPVCPTYEAKFKTVDQMHIAEVAKAGRSAGNSRLLMGIVYPKAGFAWQR